MSHRAFVKAFFLVVCMGLLLVINSRGVRGQGTPDAPQTPHQRWMEAAQQNPGRYEMPPALPAEGSANQSEPEGQAPHFVPHYYRLVYQRLAGNNWDLAVAIGESSAAPLAQSPSQEIHPRLNRGATRVVFSSNRDGDYELFAIDASGANLQQLTENDKADVNPDWSPDGKQITFESYRDGQAEIYLMSAGGTNVRRLTNHPGYDGNPLWSPDGQRIAFTSYRDGYYQIYMVGVDGRGLRRLATGAHSLYPAWSPDGNQIAFSADSDGNGWLELWLMNADGSNPLLIRNLGAQSDILAHGWMANFPYSDYIVGTHMRYISYDGNWYWTDALLKQWNEVGSMQDLAPGSGRLNMNPDTVSTDTVPPVLATFDLPRYKRHYIEHTFQPAVDYGMAGIYGVETAWQLYPGGEWVAHHWTSDSTLTHDPPAGKTYAYRLRAWDHAGNHSGWVYTNPITFYLWSLESLVTDNRGNHLPDVDIINEPAAFETVYGNGIYHSYGDEWDRFFSAQWHLEGYGAAPSRTFDRYVDGEDASIHVTIPPQNELLVNGGFESGDFDGWQVNGAAPEIRFHNRSHTGQHLLMFPIEISTALTISQTVTIPAEMPHPTLSFFYLMYPVPRAETDLFTVEITDGQQTEMLFTTSTEMTSWQHVWKDLSAWVGKTATIRFHRLGGAVEAPEVWLDDVSLGSTYGDLWLSSSGAVSALPGEKVIRTLDFGNGGGVAMPGTVLTLTLPRELTLVDASIAPEGDNPYTWDMAEVAAGDSGHVLLSLMMDAGATMGQTATAQASITSYHEAYLLNNEIDLAFLVGERVLLPIFRR